MFPLYAIVKEPPRSFTGKGLVEYADGPLASLRLFAGPPRAPARRLRSSLRSSRRLVGVTGVEPVTSSLSGTRSNQLSYTPCFARPFRLALRRTSPSGCGTGLPAGVGERDRSARLRLLACARTATAASLRTSLRSSRSLVEATGLEPVTPSLQSSCSAN